MRTVPPDSIQSEPVIALEGVIKRVTTFGLEHANGNDTKHETLGRDVGDQSTPDLPAICRTRGFLEDNGIQHKDSGRCFYPDQLLEQILTEDRVAEKIQRMKQIDKSEHIFTSVKDTSWYVDRILGEQVVTPGDPHGAFNGVALDDEVAKLMVHRPKRFFKVFAILIWCEHEVDIAHFIDADICDNDLPLVDYNRQGRSERRGLALRSQPYENIGCFNTWKVSDIELFREFQYQVLVPYFGPKQNEDEKGSITKYCPWAILPFTEEDLSKENRGGYGKVSCVRIHPLSHGFHDLKQVQAGGGLFALKLMTTEKLKDYENEVKMLKMFSGRHDHLITLLVAYTWKDRNYLLFPWADCDLEDYWKRKPPPYNSTAKRVNESQMQWISAQVLGFVSAIYKLHNADHLDPSKRQRYARHGDIKPENILWFNSEDSTQGILVIGDLGLSSIHGKESRSNVPNESVPHTPDYRPPECDQNGGTISRAFDIWTLGCLLLEMVCWVLGGNALVNEFDEDRRKVPYIGVKTNIFFDVKKTPDGGHAIMVKEVVVNWMSRLHKHEGCTGYLQDLLGIIHSGMLVVLSKEKERIRCGPLFSKVQEMHNKMVTNREYGLVPKPLTHSYEHYAAVRTELNQLAQQRTERLHDRLDIYQGQTVRSKTPLELARID